MVKPSLRRVRGRAARDLWRLDLNADSGTGVQAAVATLPALPVRRLQTARLQQGLAETADEELLLI